MKNACQNNRLIHLIYALRQLMNESTMIQNNSIFNINLYIIYVTNCSNYLSKVIFKKYQMSKIKEMRSLDGLPQKDCKCLGIFCYTTPFFYIRLRLRYTYPTYYQHLLLLIQGGYSNLIFQHLNKFDHLVNIYI